ncbi:MAG: hypothetical protein C0507_04485 [Cyanobacteria bacterium PR.3.49]|nr:hypothetical protein [Cyanobacteria bacterium PR.3.49]
MKNTKPIGRFLRRRRQIIALITSVLLSSIALAAMAEEGGVSNPSETKSADRSIDASSAVFKDIEALVKQYYPKAKIARTDKSIHFEYKARGLTGVQSGLKEFSPDSGGIAGDIVVHAGRYSGKERQPSETNHILHMVLFMAPYSEPQDQHFNTRLSYPPDASVEFLNQFKAIISDQQKGCQSVAKQPVAAPNATPQAAEPAPKVAVVTGDASASAAAGAPAASNEKAADKAQPDKTLNVQFGAKKLSKYSYPEGRFKILLPGNPQMKYSSQLGMRSVDYTYPEANGVYVINYLIAPGPIMQSKINPLLESLCNNLVANSKSTELRRTPISLQGYAGRQIELKSNKGKEESAVFRFYVVRRFVYIIGVAGNKAWVGSPVVASYLNSLEIVPELTASEQLVVDSKRRASESRHVSDSHSQFQREFDEARSRHRKDFERSQADFKFRRY